MTLILYKRLNNTPGAALVTVICTTKLHQASEVFRKSPTEVSALSDHCHCDCDGDIQDESEEDPAAPAVDGAHLRGRRSVHAITSLTFRDL